MTYATSGGAIALKPSTFNRIMRVVDDYERGVLTPRPGGTSGRRIPRTTLARITDVGDSDGYYKAEEVIWDESEEEWRALADALLFDGEEGNRHQIYERNGDPNVPAGTVVPAHKKMGDEGFQRWEFDSPTPMFKNRRQLSGSSGSEGSGSGGEDGGNGGQTQYEVTIPAGVRLVRVILTAGGGGGGGGTFGSRGTGGGGGGAGGAATTYMRPGVDFTPGTPVTVSVGHGGDGGGGGVASDFSGGDGGDGGDTEWPGVGTVTGGTGGGGGYNDSSGDQTSNLAERGGAGGQSGAGSAGSAETRLFSEHGRDGRDNGKTFSSGARGGETAGTNGGGGNGGYVVSSGSFARGSAGSFGTIVMQWNGPDIETIEST